VVDLGFTEAVGTRRGRQFLRCPGKGLAELGVDCASVQHVILSHFHYDHVGNYALFPNATFYVQDSEMAFCTGRHASQGAFRHSIEVDDVCALVRLNYERRLAFVDGSREIVPGITVHHVGGHTAGMQIVTVAHARGQAVVASDASHYYRNFSERIPFNTLHDLPRMYAAFAKIRELASSEDLVLPGTTLWWRAAQEVAASWSCSPSTHACSPICTRVTALSPGGNVTRVRRASSHGCQW
jgi:glyoxylase-like metal-dependent hydrolase (beta-lactamase superfamily II)